MATPETKEPEVEVQAPTPTGEDMDAPIMDAVPPVSAEAPAATPVVAPAPDETPVVQPPAEAVAVTPPVDEVPPAPSVREQELERELATSRQREAAQRQAQQQQANQQAARQVSEQRANQLVQQGYFTQEQAQLLVQQLQPYEEKALQQEQQLGAYAQHLSDKTNVAALLATKHGVSHQDLMQFETPQSMETFAKGQAELRQVKDQISKLTKAQVPAQAFSGGVTNNAPVDDDDDDTFIARYGDINSGSEYDTPKAHARAWAIQSARGLL